jgi:hypothetical protein
MLASSLIEYSSPNAEVRGGSSPGRDMFLGMCYKRLERPLVFVVSGDPNVMGLHSAESALCYLDYIPVVMHEAISAYAISNVRSLLLYR